MQSNLKEKKMDYTKYYSKTHTLKGGANLPQIDLEVLDETYDTWDGCYYVEVYIGGLPEGYLDNNGEEQENIPCAKIKVEFLGGEEINYIEAVFEQDAEEISDEEFMEQNQLDQESVKLLKKQIEKFVEGYVFDNWDKIMADIADVHTPDYEPRY